MYIVIPITIYKAHILMLRGECDDEDEVMECGFSFLLDDVVVGLPSDSSWRKEIRGQWDCYIRIDLGERVRNDQCKIFDVRLKPNTKMYHKPHLYEDHPLVFAVVGVNMYKDDIELAGEKLDYPKQVKESVLKSYRHVLF
jgi:hypothetical protein